MRVVSMRYRPPHIEGHFKPRVQECQMGGQGKKGKQDGGRREWRFRATRALCEGFSARDDSQRGDLIGLP